VTDWPSVTLLRAIFVRFNDRGIQAVKATDKRAADAILAVGCSAHDPEAFKSACSLVAEKVAASGMRCFVQLSKSAPIDLETGITAEVLHEPVNDRLVLRVGLCWAEQ
jgi:hypothetical protein